MEKLIYTISRWIVFPVVNRLFVSRTEGLEHIPPAGPYIIAANHSSFMDHFLISNLLYRARKKKIYFLTRKESFENYLSRKWHFATGAIPIDRDHPELSAFKTIRTLLKRGEIIVIYPEGTRSLDGNLLPPKPGVVKIAIQAKVPIIPIGINGAHRILPKGARIPRLRRADLRIGPAFDAPPTAGKDKDELYRTSERLMRVIGLLCGKDAPMITEDAPTVAES